MRIREILAQKGISDASSDGWMMFVSNMRDASRPIRVLHDDWYDDDLFFMWGKYDKHLDKVVFSRPFLLRADLRDFVKTSRVSASRPSDSLVMLA